jgi:hypothetical protein
VPPGLNPQMERDSNLPQPLPVSRLERGKSGTKSVADKPGDDKL